MITVITPGPLSTVQDLGRPGWGHLGIGVSGAADRGSLRLANSLVGNAPGCAAVEITLGRLRLRFEQDSRIALTGAPCPFTVDAAPAAMNLPVRVVAGQQVRLAAPPAGLRSYLAVTGGIDVPPVLGSRSTDTLSAIGPAILSAGMRLPIGRPAEAARPDLAALAGNLVQVGGEPVLSFTPGPRADWFTPGAVDLLCGSPWSVTVDTNRVGLRLDGPALPRSRSDELLSEPMVTGALQVPPHGRPIIFLADHPVTGGYPVIGVLTDPDIDAAAQLRPGQRLRFRSR